MNERFESLMYHAGMTAQGCWDEMDGYQREAVEKFALLIVQDCLLSLEPDPMAPEIDYEVEEKFYQRSARKIKQHFGVK